MGNKNNSGFESNPHISYVAHNVCLRDTAWKIMRIKIYGIAAFSYISLFLSYEKYQSSFGAFWLWSKTKFKTYTHRRFHQPSYYQHQLSTKLFCRQDFVQVILLC